MQHKLHEMSLTRNMRMRDKNWLQSTGALCLLLLFQILGLFQFVSSQDSFFYTDENRNMEPQYPNGSSLLTFYRLENLAKSGNQSQV